MAEKFFEALVHYLSPSSKRTELLADIEPGRWGEEKKNEDVQLGEFSEK